MSIEINFTDRTSYLEWRSNWRAAYAEQSEEIRGLKRQIKAEGNSPRASRLQSELHHARKFANLMMETLEEAKAVSRAQRELRFKPVQMQPIAA